MTTKHRLLPRVSYTTGEVAEITGLSVDTVVRAVRVNAIPATRVGHGRIYLIPAAWVKELNEGIMEQFLAAINESGDIEPGAPAGTVRAAGSGDGENGQS